MTDNTQELGEILTKLARETTLADRAADIATTADGVKVASKRFQWSIGEAKQALLDWHNKKIEEVLDRLEAQFVEEMVVIFGETEFKRQVPLSAIEAERNLKTGKKILLHGQKERN